MGEAFYCLSYTPIYLTNFKKHYDPILYLYLHYVFFLLDGMNSYIKGGNDTQDISDNSSTDFFMLFSVIDIVENGL